MYYPKSQIKTNLYTNGDKFFNTKTKQPYQGYYYETSNGQLYTGKTPQDGPNTPLSPFKENTIYDPTNVLDDPDFANNIYYSQISNITYSLITNTDTTQIRSIPSSNPTQPTTKDQSLGVFTRYFCKKNNELKYMEIDQITYTKLFTQENTIAWDLYTPIKTLWYIKGDKEKIFKANKGLISLIEQQDRWYGFTQWFQDKFLKYYLES